jgi:hypothetical protein
MNLLRHIDVIWRGRVIIAIGLVVATLMATFALFKVSDGGLSYRKPETWASSTKLLITQPGFPWGRSVLPSTADGQSQTTTAGQDSAAPTGRDQKGREVTFADPSRFAYLAWIYSHFLMGDEVRTTIPHKPAGMEILADPLTAGGNLSAATLPLIGLLTRANTKTDAVRLNADVTSALENYLREQQDATKTPTSDRVVVSTVDRAEPVLVKGHSPDLGVIAFLMVMAASVGVIYLRENIRMGRRAMAEGGARSDLQSPDFAGIDAEPALYGAPAARVERSTFR